MRNDSVPTQTSCRSIVLVISSLAGGGAERVLASLANVYAQRGIAATLLTLDDPLKRPNVYELSGEVSQKSLHVPTCAGKVFKLFRWWRQYRRVREFLMEKKPDVVLSFMTPTNLLAIAATHKLRIRCVVSERIHPAFFSYGSTYDFLRNVFYKNADAVVVQTKQIARLLRDSTAAHIVIVPNYLSREFLKFQDNANRSKQIVAIGRLDKQKGFDILVAAFAKIADDFPNWSVFILGDGPERQSLEAQVEDLGLQERVRLIGFVKQPSELVLNSAIAVQPSRFEGFPNALLELMASGLAAVATHNAGDMLIEDGVSGLLVPVDDIAALAAALRKLIVNPQLRVKLGEAAMKVRDTYSQERVLMLWDEILFPGMTIHLSRNLVNELA